MVINMIELIKTEKSKNQWIMFTAVMTICGASQLSLYASIQRNDDHADDDDAALAAQRCQRCQRSHHLCHRNYFRS